VHAGAYWKFWAVPPPLVMVALLSLSFGTASSFFTLSVFLAVNYTVALGCFPQDAEDTASLNV
jgi:hypothetical protein